MIRIVRTAFPIGDPVAEPIVQLWGSEAQIYMTYEKSWTLGQLTAYLLGILKGLEALSFIIPPLKK